MWARPSLHPHLKAQIVASECRFLEKEPGIFGGEASSRYGRKCTEEPGNVVPETKKRSADR